MHTAELFHRRLRAHDPLLARLVNGTFWNAISMALNQGGTFLGSIAVARLLGQVAFGQYAVVLSLLTSAGTLSQAGLAFAATKYIAEFRSFDQARTGRILGVCAILGPTLAIIFAVSVAAAAPFVAGPVLGSKQLAAPLAVGAIFVLFFAINNYQVGALTGLERYRLLLAPAAVGSLMTLAGVAVGAWAGGVTGAVAGLSLAVAVRWYLHHRALQREIRELGMMTAAPNRWQELPLLAGFALPATLFSYVMIPGLWLANALLVRQPDGYAQMAEYAAAQALRIMVMFIPMVMNSVGSAILNNALGNGGADAPTVHRMNRVGLTGSTAIAAALAALCGPLLLRMFGRDFAASDHTVLWILLASTVLESAFLSSLQPLQAAGRMWRLLGAVALPWQAAFAASAYILVPRFAAVGMAEAYFAGIAAALVASSLAARSLRIPATAATESCRLERDPRMSILSLVSEAPRLARWVHTQYRVRKDPVAYARSIGVTLGEGCWLFGGDIGTFGSEPYLVTIGKHVHINNGVRFITHDGMTHVLRSRHPDIDVLARIEVGDYVAIGMRAIILPGVRIGNHCIIGCAAVVNRDVPDNTIVAGVPARVIGNIDDYERKVVSRSLHTGGMRGSEKERRLREIFALSDQAGL